MKGHNICFNQILTKNNPELPTVTLVSSLAVSCFHGNNDTPGRCTIPFPLGNTKFKLLLIVSQNLIVPALSLCMKSIIVHNNYFEVKTTDGGFTKTSESGQTEIWIWPFSGVLG